MVSDMTAAQLRKAYIVRNAIGSQKLEGQTVGVKAQSILQAFAEGRLSDRDLEDLSVGGVRPTIKAKTSSSLSV
mgnify:CR=1 FL=1